MSTRKGKEPGEHFSALSHKDVMRNQHWRRETTFNRDVITNEHWRGEGAKKAFLIIFL